MKNVGDIVIEITIPKVTNAATARKVIEKLLEPIDQSRAEALMDEYGIQYSRGEYGSGETYYPKGTNAADACIEYSCNCDGVKINEDGTIPYGIWVSSSEMC